MKAFGKYISKHLLSFILFLLIMLFVDLLAFGITFYQSIFDHYGEFAPEVFSETICNTMTATGPTDEIKAQLGENSIFAFFLNSDGETIWSFNTPSEIPTSYSVQDIAVLSKSYLKDYPVFTRITDDGLLVLGYPKDSYTKILPNYYPIKMVRMMPPFCAGIIVVNVIALFVFYHLSKRKITKNIDPIISSVESLSEGKSVSLAVHGELSDIADSVNHVSHILNKQNEARANWISGVSHDIRTPLSMIMGYANRISDNTNVDESVREQAQIIEKQSVKIKELVQDLNLVSKLEYEMQPLNKTSNHLSKIVRSYVAELLNSGLTDEYSVDVNITDDAKTVELECDARLIDRAINNLVQNSIGHNSQGCHIEILLDYSNQEFVLTVKDDGVGVSASKQKELLEKQHYLESTDECLDLRHGLGLVLVHQIVAAHNGTMEVTSQPENGYCTTIHLPVCKE